MAKKVRGYRVTVLDVIKRKGEVSLKEIRESTKINYNTIRGAVIGLTKEGIIERASRGRYKIKR